MTTFFNYGKYDIEGWTQVGNVDGVFLGCWFNPAPDGSGSSITEGEESGHYILRIKNSIRGTDYKTPEEAAKAWKRFIRDNDYFPVTTS